MKDLGNYSAKLLPLVLAGVILIGMTGTVLSQSVATRTRTQITAETLEGSTVVTTITVEGGVGTVTIQYPGFVVISVEGSSGRTCVVVFRVLTGTLEQTLIIPGTTFIFAGTTFSTVVKDRTTIISQLRTESGYETTYTGLETLQTVVSYQGLMYTISVPAYGVIAERCGEQLIQYIATIIFETAPATFYFAAPGTTIAIGGATYTATVTFPADMTPITTTYTKTIPGTTMTATTTFKGTSIVTVVSLEGATTTATIVYPGTTITRTIYILETITNVGTTGVGTTSPVAETPTTEGETTAPVTRTMATEREATTEAVMPFRADPTIVAVIAALAALVAVAVALGLRARK